MPDSSVTVTVPHITLDHSLSTPLYRQLYQGLREAVLTGQLGANNRLPATRVLADALGVARNTVMNAYDQLFAEGYVRGQVGSGTYVAPVLPDRMLRGAGAAGIAAWTAPRRPDLSRRGVLIASTMACLRSWGGAMAFPPSVPAVDAFPIGVWAKLVARRLRCPTDDLLGYSDPAGYLPLREAIAAHLRGSRGVHCEVSQVLVVSGSQQALDLAARMLLDEGDPAWIEDPGYPGARNALLGAGASLVPVPVDGEGLDVASGVAREASARLVYVTPSFQYPLGVTMTLARRLALLDWARGSGAWILEDDYDGEYHYLGRPLAALHALDVEGRVIYVGSFSKVLFPSLRLGYMVVPRDLLSAFAAARALADRQSPLLEQAVLADFIAQGHFVRHLRRMRVLYRKRQKALVRAAAHELAGLLEVRPADAGMHLVGWLPGGADDREVSRRAAAHGVEAPALSLYRLEPSLRHGLVLGYTGVNENRIRAGVSQLAAALRAPEMET